MALTPAEKQRRYRDRIAQDPQKLEDRKRKDRERWHARKSAGKVNAVENMSDREHRRAKKYWRVTKANYRNRLKDVANIATPPHSPEHLHVEPRNVHSVRVIRNRRKLTKKISKLTKKLEEQKREAQKYKKRWQRVVQSIPETPRKRCTRLLAEASTEIIQKKLLMHHVLVDQIRQRYKEQKGERQRRGITKLLASSLVKKYRLQKDIQIELGLSKRRILSCSNSKITIKRKKYTSAGTRFQDRIVNFYTRDDNSRMAAGKRETKTENKVKRQKRLLTDSIKNLHVKFLAENPTCKVSYTLFSRLRPFWVVQPTEHDRQTCLCKLHENTQFATSKLNALHVLSTGNPDELVKLVTCNVNSKNCMYGQCDTCREPVLPFSHVDLNAKTTWKRWVTTRENRTIKDESKQIMITAKEETEGSVGDLIDTCKDLLVRYKKHTFNIVHQHKQYRNLRQNMKENECLIHIDFAENYACKLSDEIQSMHFGASKKQVTLHTGVAYVGPNAKATSFCTVSDSLQHGPGAIWAHLDPVLDNIQSKHALETVHVFSDGPTTQYRQRGNFFLFTQNMAKRGILKATWNFFEAGHGKGAPDGVGAAVKRHADRLVLQGKDIVDATSLYKELHEDTSINMYLIESKQVEHEVDSLFSLKIATVPGTMAVHQILWEAKNVQTIRYRDISCICELHHFCECYDPKVFHFPTPQSKAAKAVHNSKPQQDTTKCSLEQSDSRKKFFAELLTSLQKCTTFATLKKMCNEVEIPYDIIACSQIFDGTDAHIDKNAEKLMPDDVAAIKDHVPIKVSADGDCLPHSASFWAFGNEENHVELRARIVIELAVHGELYLNENHLRKGINCTDKEAKQLTTSYCLYSGNLEIKKKLTRKDIKRTYETEVLEATKENEYMGIFQLFGLASVLGSKLHLIYPNKGNPNVRKDLGRILHPRDEKPGAAKTYIMWTTTKPNVSYFVPNHFVPLVPNSHPSEQNATVELDLIDSPMACKTSFDLSKQRKPQCTKRFRSNPASKR